MSKDFNISIKRTKMIDEAAYNHKPMRLSVSVFVFLLVFLISSFAEELIRFFPQILYILSQGEAKQAITDFATGSISFEEYIRIITEVWSNVPDWMTIVFLMSTVALMVFSVLYCKLFEKRKLSSMGLRKKNAVREYLVGLAIGLCMYSLVTLLLVVTKSATVKINPSGVSALIILFFVAFSVQGAAEEFLTRGYFMVSVARDYSTIIAIVSSSILFSVFHIGNAGFGILPFINIFLFGFFIGVYIFKRGNILGACAIHTMWNFAQGNIFGSSVSGMKRMPSVFVTVLEEDRVVANGGAFGPEGGVAVTIILLIAIGITLMLKTNPSELSDTEKNTQRE